MTNSHGITAFYLFCFARSEFLSTLKGTGMDGRNPLFLGHWLNIAAVLSPVPLEDFSGSSADLKMQDLAWLGPNVCLHESVIEQVMRLSPVLPVPFGTLFSSLKILEELLEKHYDAISEFLGRVADKEEWGVKGLLDKALAKQELFSAALPVQGAIISSSSPGMRYIQEQRLRAAVEKELSGWLKQVCEGVVSDLCHYASDFRERKIISACEVETGIDTVLNWAFLVPQNAVVEFHAQINQTNKDYALYGLVFELSGPWPPYSFCSSLVMKSNV